MNLAASASQYGGSRSIHAPSVRHNACGASLQGILADCVGCYSCPRPPQVTCTSLSAFTIETPAHQSGTAEIIAMRCLHRQVAPDVFEAALSEAYLAEPIVYSTWYHRVTGYIAPPATADGNSAPHPLLRKAPPPATDAPAGSDTLNPPAHPSPQPSSQHIPPTAAQSATQRGGLPATPAAQSVHPADQFPAQFGLGEDRGAGASVAHSLAQPSGRPAGQHPAGQAPAGLDAAAPGVGEGAAQPPHREAEAGASPTSRGSGNIADATGAAQLVFGGQQAAKVCSGRSAEVHLECLCFYTSYSQLPYLHIKYCNIHKYKYKFKYFQRHLRIHWYAFRHACRIKEGAEARVHSWYGFRHSTGSRTFGCGAPADAASN